MLKHIRHVFEALPQPVQKGVGNLPTFSLVDCLMSGLAIVGLKFSSLLQFDQARWTDIHRNYSMANSDKKMLDEINLTEGTIS